MRREFEVPVLSAPISGRVKVPGSKSIANRALILAALSMSESEITNVPDGDDTQAMIAGLRILGSIVEVSGSNVHVIRPVPLDEVSSVRIDAQLAGTTSRFLTALAALRSGPVTIDGGEPLRKRPNLALRLALQRLGAVVESEVGDGLPITVRRGSAFASEVTIDGSISSQFISALMMIGAAMPDGLRIVMAGSVVSRSYIELTAAVMRDFGVSVEVSDKYIFVKPGGVSGRNFAVEADASSASYPLAAAAICGGRVVIEGLGSKSTQSDSIFSSLLEAMGCTVDVDSASTSVSRSIDQPLRGISVDLSDASDLVPSLVAVCCFAETPSTIGGVGFIRRKESNRIEGLAEQLQRLGANVVPTEDGLEIFPATLHGGRIDSMHDHRIAMASSIIGLTVPGVVIEDPDVVSKSWPSFWNDFRQLGS
jgi:3-phosphoshikimate 1-carboxyvinyltransferase